MTSLRWLPAGPQLALLRRRLRRTRAIAGCLSVLLVCVWTAGCGGWAGVGIDRPGAERELALATIARLKADVGQRPWDRESLGTLAVNQWIAGDYDDAERSFTRALAMSSDRATIAAKRETVLQFVELLFRRGRFVKAAAVWKQSGLTDDLDAKQQWLRDFLALYDASLRHAPAAGAIAVPDARLEFRNSIGMTFLPVPGGRFNRGCETCDADARPVRSVEVLPLLFGKYEVTVAEYRLFMRETGWRRQVQGDGFEQARDDHPAYGVSWLDAQAFTIWLSAREQAVYRLPSEAEWELAARGGIGNLEPWGNEPGQPQASGNWGRTSPGELRQIPPPTSAVGSFPKDRSALGLFDMAGNVREWCLDDYDASYYAWSPDRNPLGPVASGDGKVLRGGAWNHPPRSGSRFALIRSRAAVNHAYTGYGFRVVREILTDIAGV